MNIEWTFVKRKETIFRYYEILQQPFAWWIGRTSWKIYQQEHFGTCWL